MGDEGREAGARGREAGRGGGKWGLGTPCPPPQKWYETSTCPNDKYFFLSRLIQPPQKTSHSRDITGTEHGV